MEDHLVKFPYIDSKVVSKPWGNEIWVADGKRTPYALKRITFLAGKRSSLHVHEFKFETNLVISGNGFFEISANPIDISQVKNDFSLKQLLPEVLHDLISVPIGPGDIIDVQPHFVHRVTAESDLTFVEASTSELDDVFRLVDDAGRNHGRLEIEHND